MMVRQILVEFEADLPLMWAVVIHVLDQKYPDYRNATVTFWKLPNIQQWRFSEPDEATAIADAYNPKDYTKLPTLRIEVENADINATDGEGSYQGYLVTVCPDYWNTKNMQQYALIGEEPKTLTFADLKRVSHPKLAPVK